MPIDGDISAQYFYANDKMFSSFISSCCHLREEISKIPPILILMLSRSDKYGRRVREIELYPLLKIEIWEEWIAILLLINS